MKISRKCMSWLLVLALIVGFSLNSYAANVWDSDFLQEEQSTEQTQTQSESVYEKIAEKSGRELFADKKTGCFYVRDVKSGECWYSNPKEVSDDDASGIYQMEARSLLLFTTYNTDASMIEKGNSEALGVRAGTVNFQTVEDGFTVTYTIPDFKLTVPLTVKMTEQGLIASVVTEKIKESGNLLSLSVLPYFHAGLKTEKGCILLPDGSGSLMDFNNGHTASSNYEATVYGSDVLSSSVTKPQNSHPVKMPVFGINKENASLFAIISEGAAQSVIHASVNGKDTSFANCYSEFVLRGSDTVVLGETMGNPQIYQMYQKDDIDFEKIEISYNLLTGNNIDYNDFAQIYRDWLIKRYGLSEHISKNANLYLDFYGSVKKKKSFLGIPYTTNETLSTLTDIEKTVKDLQNDGVEGVNVVLKNWSKAQSSSKADVGVSPLKRIGGVKQLQQLNRVLKNNGGALALQFEIQKIRKSGNGVSVFSDSIRNISYMPAGVYTFSLNTLVKNNNYAKKYILKSSVQAELINKVKESSDKQGFENIALTSVDCYSDYDEKTVSRSRSTQTLADALKKSFTDKKVMTDFPADYTFATVKVALDVPTTSNGYSMTNRSIPFYQLALSGLIECVTAPANLTSQTNILLLQSLETGSSIHFTLLTEDNERVMNTELDWLNTCDYKLWKERIVNTWQIQSELKKQSAGTRMIRHSAVAKDVYCSTYENGMSVFVNYGTNDYESGSLKVPAGGYCFRQKGGNE